MRDGCTGAKPHSNRPLVFGVRAVQTLREIRYPRISSRIVALRLSRLDSLFLPDEGILPDMPTLDSAPRQLHVRARFKSILGQFHRRGLGQA